MPIPTTVEKFDRPLAREQVYAQLRTWIIEGILKPGEAIKDLTLAASLGVSRTPVREALQRLSDEGLIETASSRYTRVAALETDKADELYGIVQRLESYALELAAPHLSQDDYRTLEDCNARLEAAIVIHDPRAALEADNDFHLVWIDKSASQELARILADLKTKLRRLELAHFDSGDAMESVREHTQIIKELRSKHRSNAARALEGNWEGATYRFSRRVGRSKV